MLKFGIKAFAAPSPARPDRTTRQREPSATNLLPCKPRQKILAVGHWLGADHAADRTQEHADEPCRATRFKLWPERHAQHGQSHHSGGSRPRPPQARMPLDRIAGHSRNAKQRIDRMTMQIRLMQRQTDQLGIFRRCRAPAPLSQRAGYSAARCVGLPLGLRSSPFGLVLRQSPSPMTARKAGDQLRLEVAQFACLRGLVVAPA